MVVQLALSEARKLQESPAASNSLASEVGRTGPVAVPISASLCEELFLQAPRRTICSCSLDHAGSSVTFPTNKSLYFEIKEELIRVGKYCEKQSLTILSYPLVPSRNQKDSLLPKDNGGSCHVFESLLHGRLRCLV